MEPSSEQIRAGLARLVARGSDAVWLPEVQPLLQLPAVRAKLDELGEEHAAEALRAVLIEAIDGLGKSQYQRLLTIVLGLDPAYASLSAGEKRRIAGQEFRGGHRQVSAGTIRQHHEPRALNELAARLLPSSPAQSRRPTAPDYGEQRIEWHPAVRRAWLGERLSFWRVSLREYHADEVKRRLDASMRQAGITSWAAFEMLGVFDLLVRAWLPPASSAAEVEQAAAESFGGDLVLFERFDVDEILMHWPWRKRGKSVMPLPFPAALEAPPPAQEIEQVNAGDPSAIAKYRDQGLAIAAPRGKGIAFVMAVTAQRRHPLAPSGAPAAIAEEIARVIDAAPADVIAERSLYRGSGFADFLLQGCVRPDAFHEIRSLLLEPLEPVLRVMDYRTHTFVLSKPSALICEETLRVQAPRRQERTAKEWLEQEETSTFEVKGSAFTYLAREGPQLDPKVAQSLTKTIAAMLNASGGTVLIGAVDRQRAENDPRLSDRPEFDQAPKVGPYTVNGIDWELTDDLDQFEQRLRSMLATSIEPDPSHFIDVRFDRVGQRTVCMLTVPESSRANMGTWFYLDSSKGSQFVVRTGSANRTLAGIEADNYKRLNPR